MKRNQTLVAEPVFIREHYWEEEKPVFANNLPYDIDDTCFFFYKHNTYKPIQPGISEKNKHMLSIVPSLESSFFFLFFSCLKSHSEAYSEPCQTSKMKLLPKIVNVF